VRSASRSAIVFSVSRPSSGHSCPYGRADHRGAAGRVPLVAGIGGNDTNEIVHGFKNFDLRGYDAILSVSPYYNKPNQEGIFQHYKTLDANTPLPIIMYNVPSRTGQNVTADTQVRIAIECKNIFATPKNCWKKFIRKFIIDNTCFFAQVVLNTEINDLVFF